MAAIVGSFTLVHEDGRRKISEFNSVKADRSAQSFEVKEPIPLGNHFHRRRFETFVITGGGGKVTTCTVDEQGQRVGESVTTDVIAGSVVFIPPLTAHTFVLEPGSTMLCAASIAFDPKDMDMHTHELVKPGQRPQ